MSDSVEDIGRHGSKIAKIVKNIAKRSRFTSPGSESVEQESERGGGRVRLGDLFDHDEGGDVNPEQEQHWPYVLVEAEQGGSPGAPRGKDICSSFLTCTNAQNAQTFLCQFFRGSANFRRQFQVRELSGYQFASPTPKSMKEVTFSCVFVLNYSIFSQFYLFKF